MKLTVKASAEKAWLLYVLPFSLNPGLHLNHAQTLKNYSSLYPEGEFQANLKKKMIGHFGDTK